MNIVAKAPSEAMAFTAVLKFFEAQGWCIESGHDRILAVNPAYPGDVSVDLIELARAIARA